MAAAKPQAAPGLGDDEDVELVPDNCAASCVTCGQDPTSTNWPIASSLSCLVGAGCVVLPPDEFEDEAVLRRRSDGTTAAVARPARGWGSRARREVTRLYRCRAVKTKVPCYAYGAPRCRGRRRPGGPRARNFGSDFLHVWPA